MKKILSFALSKRNHDGKRKIVQILEEPEGTSVVGLDVASGSDKSVEQFHDSRNNSWTKKQ